jgi:hypothetical protein
MSLSGEERPAEPQVEFPRHFQYSSRMEQTMQFRSSVSETAEGLEITIPAPRHWFVLAFLAVWLTGWAFGELSALQSLYSSRDSILAAGFLLFWLVGWTVGGAVAGYFFLWMAVGRERILVRADTIMIRREIIGLGRIRSYDLSAVRNLRVQKPTRGAKGNRIGWGLIAFESGGQTVRFGMVFSKEEAQMIVDRIKGRFSIASDASVLPAEVAEPEDA